MALAVALCCLSDICVARGPGTEARAYSRVRPQVQVAPWGRPPSRPPSSAEPWLRVYRFVKSWGFRTFVVIIVSSVLLAVVYNYARQHAPYPPDRSPLHRAGCLGLLVAVLGAPVLGVLGGVKVGVAWLTWLLLLGVIALTLVNRVSRRCRMCRAPLAFSRDVSARHPDRCIRCELIEDVQRHPRYRPAQAAPMTATSRPTPGAGRPSPRIARDDFLSALLGMRSVETRASAAARPFPWQATTATRAIPEGRVAAEGDELAGKKCPYCQTKIAQGEVALLCPRCGVPHHAECWTENGGCTVYGCELEPFG